MKMSLRVPTHPRCRCNPAGHFSRAQVFVHAICDIADGINPAWLPQAAAASGRFEFQRKPTVV
jgi:hypothetical protein